MSVSDTTMSVSCPLVSPFFIPRYKRQISGVKSGIFTNLLKNFTKVQNFGKVLQENSLPFCFIPKIFPAFVSLK